MGTVTIKQTKETGLKGHLNAGLSSRGGGWGFSLATMNVAPGPWLLSQKNRFFQACTTNLVKQIHLKIMKDHSSCCMTLPVKNIMLGSTAV